METQQYDIIVIGSGGGMKIALPAARMGLKTRPDRAGRGGRDLPQPRLYSFQDAHLPHRTAPPVA